MIKKILAKIIVVLTISTIMKVGAKLASYICQAIILIVAAELKTITAAKRKEIFLKILPNKQKILTLSKNA